jgi:outer membrane protein assembly factor BamB
MPSLIDSAAPDWPQWRGPRRDGISVETGLLQSWPEGGPSLLWEVSGIGRGYSSPIVVGDRVYITGDQGKDLAISVFTLAGQPQWKTTNGACWENPYPGARSSCTYDDGKLYHLNAHGRLVCLDAATGGEVWAVNVLERYAAKNIMWGISESVVVHGDRVFSTPAGAKGLMVAHDKRTGAPLWASPALDGEQASYSSPILINVGNRKLLVNGGLKYVFAVDAAFGVQLGDGSASRAWTTELSISHGGTICVDGQLCGSSSRGEASGWVTINAATGKPTQVSESPGGSLIFAEGRFYCLSATGIMTLQELTNSGFRTVGTFRLAEGKDVWAHPVLCQGRLFLRYHDTLYCYDVRR